MAQIRRWSPFAELEAFRREVDRLFREFFGEERAPVTRGWSPMVDIYETPAEVILQAELPGVKKEDLQIELSDDRLTLKGKKERPEEAENATYHLLERHYGEFERSFVLNVPVDIEKAEATYRDGVLVIRLPKVEPKRAKRIEVRVES
ncbi:MAG: Hsp20/alpha crystallin family protein [Candidatus Fervidibacter sp.]|uniref:Hsp20/alpha crystallin family protein n=1 Tax=Candidatus Fervidibacter sp. TaxID=3100871 RepID=UPI00404AC8AB